MRYSTRFFKLLSADPGRVVLHSLKGPVTAGDVLSLCRDILSALDAYGDIEGGVAIPLVRPGTPLLASFLAAIMSGLKMAMIDPEMGADNYKSKLEQLDPVLYFVDSALLFLLEHPVAYALARRFAKVPLVRLPRGARILSVGKALPIVRPHRHVARSRTAGLEAPAGPADHAGAPLRTGEFSITYTSGTLATPKGVVGSLQSLEESMKQLSRLIGEPAGQRIATHLPHYTLLGISIGVPVYSWDLSWGPGRKLTFIKDHGITTLFGPPSDFLPMVQELEKNGETFPPSLGFILLGSAPVYPAFLKRLRAKTGGRIRVECLYGMTENLLVATATIDDKLAFGEDGDFVGHPVPGVEIRVSDEGELLVRSSQMFTRYFHEAGREDWHATGDLGRVRNDGSIVLLGRKKDMIIRGNFNLYPALYESTVARIEGVNAAVFVGVYDEKRADEIVYLAVEPDEQNARNGKAFRQYLAVALKSGSFAIDTQAYPDEIVLLTMPRSGRSQKIDKNAIRQILRNRS